MRRVVTRTARATLTGASRLLNFHKRHPPAGAPPGTLVFPEERTPAIVRITGEGTSVSSIACWGTRRCSAGWP